MRKVLSITCSIQIAKYPSAAYDGRWRTMLIQVLLCLTPDNFKVEVISQTHPIFISREKRRKPKFIVTLEGVGNEFEEKYEKERKKKKRKGSQKEENNIAVPQPAAPQVIPVYPPLVRDVHHVPVLPPPHLSNPHLNSIVPVQVIPTTIMAPIDTHKPSKLHCTIVFIIDCGYPVFYVTVLYMLNSHPLNEILYDIGSTN